MAADFKLLGGHPLWIRLLSLYGGLFLFGMSAGLVIESRLGNFPWDVLHEGAALPLDAIGIPISVGVVAIIVSFLILLLGLAWLVTFYLSSGSLPVEAWGYWNLGVGFAILVVGLVMSTRWR